MGSDAGVACTPTSLRILLIDDNPMDRELAARALHRLPEPLGMVDLVAVESWDAARPHLATSIFDVLLLDFNLPGMDGLSILNELAAESHPPVIMMTGQNDLQTAVEILRSGAYDYVQKTSSDIGPALRLAITRVVDRVRLERELAASHVRLASYASELEQKVESRTLLVLMQAAEIEASYLHAEDALRVKTQIIANLSHELRTPLHTIIGYTDVLEDDLPAKGGNAARATLTKVRGQVERLRAAIESLLTLAQLRNGRTDTTLTRFTCATFLDELRTDATRLNVDKGLILAFESPSPNVEVEHDHDKLRAIAYHLLSNAIKFTHNGRVTATFAATDAGLWLTIVDTGVGLPAEARQLLFEDFRQLDGSSTRAFDGLGLGLGIVKRFATLLGGSVTLESVLDTGTTVRVEIPLIRPSTPMPASTRTLSRRGKADRPRARPAGSRP